jgi:hypothetical protein
MRRHPVVSYVALAYAITWIGVLQLALGASVPRTFHAVGALGPVGAAIVVTAVAHGRRGLSALWLAITRWRGGNLARYTSLSVLVATLANTQTNERTSDALGGDRRAR